MLFITLSGARMTATARGRSDAHLHQRRRGTFLAVLFGGLVIAAACGGGERPGETGTSGTTGTAGTTTERSRQGQTAVGDTRVFEIPATLTAGQRVCGDESRTLLADDTRPFQRPDAQMRNVGRCENPPLTLYAPEVSGEEANSQAAAHVYVKTGEGLYLRLRAEATR